MPDVEPYVVTPVGAEKLKVRIREIKERDRPQNVADIEEALGHGDLKENAEYHAAKERQALLDSELKRLQDRLSRVQVIDPASLSGDRVSFGAKVTILNLETDEETTYQLVGENETDTKAGLISYKSPLAKALMGREEGDEVKFRAPAGLRELEIMEVAFE